MASVSFIVRFECDDRIVDARMALREAVIHYKSLKDLDEPVDLICIKDGIEYCLM